MRVSIQKIYKTTSGVDSACGEEDILLVALKYQRTEYAKKSEKIMKLEKSKSADVI